MLPAPSSRATRVFGSSMATLTSLSAERVASAAASWLCTRSLSWRSSMTCQPSTRIAMTAAADRTSGTTSRARLRTSSRIGGGTSSMAPAMRSHRPSGASTSLLPISAATSRSSATSARQRGHSARCDSIASRSSGSTASRQYAPSSSSTSSCASSLTLRLPRCRRPTLPAPFACAASRNGSGS